MEPLSDGAILELRDMTAAMYKDSVEVNPIGEVDDGYGHALQKFPSSGVFTRGSLQPVVRIPGTPEGGGTTTTVGDFLLKLQADAPLPDKPQKCQFVVNGGSTYQAENVYRDMSNRLSTSIYCVKVD